MHDRVRLGRRGFLLLGGAGVLAACSSSQGGSTAAPSSEPSSAPTSAAASSAASAAPSSSGTPAAGTITQISTGLNVPWGLAFLPGGDALVAERETGRILRVPARGGEAQELVTLSGVDTDGTSEGGLLGLAVSSTYARDQLVYAYYTADDDNRIVRFKADSTTDVQPIVTGLLRGSIHNGGRIGFGPDGKLYAGVGDTGDRSLAQDPASWNGKILRVNPDGSIPADNPVRGSAVWSLGHRNVQGFAWDSAKRMWAVEFGQDTYDEVNLIEPGKNYGWPVVEGVGDTAGGRYVNPKITWSTDEASPSGAAIIGDTLYIGALRGEAVLRVALSGTNATKSSSLAESEYGRIRTVAAAPDGALWFTTSNRDGRGNERSGDDHIYRVQV